MIFWVQGAGILSNIAHLGAGATGKRQLHWVGQAALLS